MTESPTPDRDYPQLLGERGLIEPAPRRVRGYFDKTLVFDTARAHYVWEIAYYPQYYIPTSDMRMDHLRDENHVQKLQFGSSRLYSLTSAERTWPSAAHVYDSGPAASTRGMRIVLSLSTCVRSASNSWVHNMCNSAARVNGSGPVAARSASLMLLPSRLRVRSAASASSEIEDFRR
ncbi:MAG: hypothetical protein JWP83_537 [Mycobacterium sp.]|jgi:uncharacterized protein (DUF427 family)|nr:hypothetical protein [Mycobacterium sp.]